MKKFLQNKNNSNSNKIEENKEKWISNKREKRQEKEKRYKSEFPIFTVAVNSFIFYPLWISANESHNLVPGFLILARSTNPPAMVALNNSKK